MTKKTMKPCPFCGCEMVPRYWFDACAAQVECDECGALGPLAVGFAKSGEDYMEKGREAALAQWNKRAEKP